MTAVMEEHISVPLGAATLQIPRDAAINAWLAANLRLSTSPPAVLPPAIGSEWPGEHAIYAGLARGTDGARDYHLLVPLDPVELEEVEWPDAMSWAANAGLALPTRQEARILWANVPELFQPNWYWLSTQYAGTEASAWAQDFGNGLQVSYLKGHDLRARPVRRLTI